MLGLSNGLLGLVNFLTLFFSIPIIGVVAILNVYDKTECGKLFQLPFFTIGILLLVVSFMGLVGSCCRATLLLKIYIGFVFLWILAFSGFIIFTLVVTNKESGVKVSKMAYNEYRLEDFSDGLKRLVMDPNDWLTIKSCILNSQVCAKLPQHPRLDALQLMPLSPVESNCCKPPSYCGYEYRNTTFWTIPRSGLTSIDHDCLSWSNSQATLCYNCNSCKAGFLANLNDYMRSQTNLNVCYLFFLIFILVLGLHALKNNQAGNNTKCKGHA